MRVSTVVLTDEEVRKQMEADNKPADEIDKAITERQANAQAVQEQYDKKTSAPFVQGLADG